MIRADEALVVFRWLPWMDEVVRLESQGYGAGEIAPRLNRTVSEVAVLMEREEFKAQRACTQDRLRFLFEDRLMQLWGLSEEAIKAAEATIAQYSKLLAGGEVNLKDIRALRADVIVLIKDVLDRIGLKAPEKSELKVTSRSEVEDVTSLETYEKRLEIVKAYREAGMVVPAELGIVELEH